MLTSQAFKSRTGQHYTLRLTNKSAQLNALKAESFSDKNAASYFVHNLQVPLFFWENLARSNTFFSYNNWKNANPWAGIEDYIAQTLVQGSVVAYETASISKLTESRQVRSFKDSSGKGFELQPATALLVDSTAEVQPVHDKASAIKILQDLDITTHSAESLNKSLNLPANNGTSIEVLVSALIKGDVVLTQQAEALKPESTGDFVDAVFEAAKSPVEPPPPAPPPPQAEATPSAADDASSPPADSNSSAAGSSSSSESQETANKEPTVRDDKTTADVLTKAAEDGTPFCEECEKAKEDKKAA